TFSPGARASDLCWSSARPVLKALPSSEVKKVPRPRRAYAEANSTKSARPPSGRLRLGNCGSSWGPSVIRWFRLLSAEALAIHGRSNREDDVRGGTRPLGRAGSPVG